MKQTESKWSALLCLLVFTLFALCLLLVLLTGVEGYEALTARSEAQHTRRTALRYLTTRVRQAEGVRLEDFSGSPALVLEETAEGECYITRVYCHGGWLRELYSLSEGAFSPEDGEKLLEADSLTVKQEGTLLRAELTVANGETLTLWLALPGEREGAP